MLKRLRIATSAWTRTTWELDPVLVLAAPLVVVFYAAAIFGPVLVVLFWQRPPLIIGIAAALLGFGVMTRVVVEGFAARSLAVMSRRLGSDLAATRSWALVMRATLATAWLIPIAGVWSSAIENELHPDRASVTADYARLALWHVGDVIPGLNVPRTLGHVDPPLTTWGLGTGIALVALGLVVLYSIILVVTELGVRRGGRGFPWAEQ